MERFLNRGAWFVCLAFVQVLFLNKICLLGWATPFVYVYLILTLDKDIDRNALMVIAFLMGFTIDIFSNTPGVNAGALVLVAFLRPGLLQLFSPRGEYENFEPGIYTLGMWAFVRYAAVMVLFHHMALFSLETFSFEHFGFMLLRVFWSTLLTMMLVIAIECVRHKR